jgi:hypothetical protein
LEKDKEESPLKASLGESVKDVVEKPSRILTTLVRSYYTGSSRVCLPLVNDLPEISANLPAVPLECSTSGITDTGDAWIIPDRGKNEMKGKV